MRDNMFLFNMFKPYQGMAYYKGPNQLDRILCMAILHIHRVSQFDGFWL